MDNGQYPVDVFNFEGNHPTFETFGKENGIRYWHARDFMSLLGYKNYNTFRAVINKAIAACVAININVAENFVQEDRIIDGVAVPDFRLTRFACYLIAMNGDPKLPQVAKAQVYFIYIAETFRNYIEESENVERVLVREELSDREKSLSGVAMEYGVIHYPLFQNAGYRGMYNKNLNDLKNYKGLGDCKRSLLDFMCKEELASNLFRITQTEAKIKKDGIRGQKPLEVVAETIGKQVRKAMHEMSGTRPEDLPLVEDIKDVKRGIKQTFKKFKEIDKK